MHVLSIQRQIFLGGNLYGLLQVLFNVLPYLVPGFVIGEWANWWDIVCIHQASKLLYNHTYEAWMLPINDESYLLF